MVSGKIVYRIVETPIGEFVAGASSKGCCLFEFLDRGGIDRLKGGVEGAFREELVRGQSDLVDQAESDVAEYFAGRRATFSLQLDLRGTPFELAVWDKLLEIPYGCTTSYGEIACALGIPGGARAVGRASGANRVAIIVPCHRVIHADDSIGGYGGGSWRKKHLLELEGRLFSSPISPALLLRSSQHNG